ncbi:MAG: DUF882 domain-containing protein [Geminicoccaceae bacterium]
MHRRTFLGATAAAGLLMAAPGMAHAARTPRRLVFESINTGEKLDVVYAYGGNYQLEALEAINYHLRDWRTDTVKPIDPRLLDLLVALRRTLDVGETTPYTVICGYRTPRTNDMLRERSRGVAVNSYHLRGQAIDIRVPGRRIRDVRNAARALGRGGVGSYRSFVHVDTGPVRVW